MKKQIAKTISILSLFVVLSVSASNVSAFPRCPGMCQPAVRYAASAPAQTANSATVQIASPAPAQDTMAVDAQSAGAGSFVFWAQLALLFAHLL